jgi:hypothetical protein
MPARVDASDDWDVVRGRGRGDGGGGGVKEIAFLFCPIERLSPRNQFFLLKQAINSFSAVPVFSSAVGGPTTSQLHQHETNPNDTTHNSSKPERQQSPP